MADGTPLPNALTGNIVERVVRLDSALLYLVDGVLAFLLDREPLEQTGALTVETAKNALSDMFWAYLTEDVALIPIGTIAMWPTITPPPKWLLLHGAGAISKTTYPELFDLFGYTHGGGGDIFVLPTMSGLSPYGSGADVNNQAVGGAADKTLSVANLPAHNHGQQIGNQPAYQLATGTGRIAYQVLSTVSLARVVSDNTGDNEAFSLLHPVRAWYFIIYAGH